MTEATDNGLPTRDADAQAMRSERQQRHIDIGKHALNKIVLGGAAYFAGRCSQHRRTLFKEGIN